MCVCMCVYELHECMLECAYTYVNVCMCVFAQVFIQECVSCACLPVPIDSRDRGQYEDVMAAWCVQPRGQAKRAQGARGSRGLTAGTGGDGLGRGQPERLLNTARNTHSRPSHFPQTITTFSLFSVIL